jgi:hypothetical protein
MTEDKTELELDVGRAVCALELGRAVGVEEVDVALELVEVVFSSSSSSPPKILVGRAIRGALVVNTEVKVVSSGNNVS